MLVRISLLKASASSDRSTRWVSDASDRWTSAFAQLRSVICWLRRKRGLSHVDLLAPLRARLHAPIAIDTDVATAALAEWRLGSGRGFGSVAYVTVGTGIGADLASGDRREDRIMHPEMGHIAVRRAARDAFEGVCPFHSDCLEGLASGLAINKRWGCALSELPQQHDT